MIQLWVCLFSRINLRQKCSSWLLSFLRPSMGRLQVVAAVKGRGGSPDPLCELNCFNQGPMWTLTKEPGRNHRLLLCCRGSHRGWERAAGSVAAPCSTAGLLFICCFIPGDSEGGRFPLGFVVLWACLPVEQERLTAQRLTPSFYFILTLIWVLLCIFIHAQNLKFLFSLWNCIESNIYCTDITSRKP